MPKKLIQDIIVRPKKILKQAAKPPDAFYDFSKEDKESHIPAEKKPKRKFKLKFSRLKIPRFKIPRFLSGSKYKLIGALLAAAVLITFGAVILNKFSSIVVEITPRLEIIEAADAVFTAGIEPENKELPLEIMRINRKESGSSMSTGIKEINSKASGRIVIYNAYSSQPQPIVVNTRFEAPDGKIYRINNPLVIPGAKIENGKIVASEIETTVFADKPGEEYNIGLTDFIIPGFQSAEKREKIYARSKTEMAGGFVGLKKIITEDDISALKNSLRGKITDYFSKTAVNPKPGEFLFYDAARKTIFSAENEEGKNGPEPGNAGDVLELKENGTFYGFLIKKDDLGRALAEKYFSAEMAEKLDILNPENLDFELKNFEADKITFGIKGRVRFAWKIAEDGLKNELIAERKNPGSVFGRYEAVEKAKIIFKPSWWRKIPQKPSKISIKRIIS